MFLTVKSGVNVAIVYSSIIDRENFNFEHYMKAFSPNSFIPEVIIGTIDF